MFDDSKKRAREDDDTDGEEKGDPNSVASVVDQTANPYVDYGFQPRVDP